MNELALFAGAGGGILGGTLLGWRTICAVEFDKYARSVLMARQNDGSLEPFPIWDDVRTFDGKPWRGIVDVVSGGFPCQDISTNGRMAGIDGERSGLWGEMARIIGEVRPRFAFVENSPALTTRGLGRVLGDLAALGYDARWGVLGARHTGAQHKRDRIWIVADCNEESVFNVGHCSTEYRQSQQTFWHETIIGFLEDDDRTLPQTWRATGCQTASGPIMRGDPDGLAKRMDRIACVGNGQVPAVASLAWTILGPQESDE